ncbi:MAG: hypothetical protein HRU23_02435 [Gammaproteobacteria bacterium]|nr:hypothetical protein [Gammaproteobacteria bacterium]
MQVTNSTNRYSSVFGTSNHQTKATSNDKSDFSTSENTTTGISIKGTVELSYKYDFLSFEEFSKIPGMADRINEMENISLHDGSPQHIQQYKDHFSNVANQQDTKAIIRVGDEVVAIFQHTGGVTSKSNFSNLINQANGDIDTLNNLLTQKYGEDFSIETFEQGKGPTGAESFEIFNGYSLSSYVDEEVLNMENSYYLNLQKADDLEKQRILYNHAPQTAVFKVGGEIVGSINEKGYVDINLNIKEQADAKGIDRESLKPFYSYDQMHDTDTASMMAMLSEVFGEDVEVEQFNQDNMPTLAQTRSKASAQVLPL